MSGPARFATYIGRVLMFVGFVMIVLAWDGAAGLDFIQGQFPYLLSGAIPGLALIIVGAGLEYIQAIRQITAERAKQMAELNLTVVKLVGFMREEGPAADAPVAALPEKAPEAAIPATVGAGAPAQKPSSAYAPPTADNSEDPVVAGRSSFHAASCHLVSGRDDMATITRLEAEGQGLNPCRVCKP